MRGPFRYERLFILLPTLTAGLLLKACGPLAASVEKGARGEYASTEPQVSVPAVLPFFQLGYRAEFFRDHAPTIQVNQLDQLQRISLTGEHLQQLRSDAMLSIRFSQAIQPSSAIAIFKLSLPDETILEKGLKSLETRFAPSVQAEGSTANWRLEAPRALTDQSNLWALVSSHLEAAQIILLYDKKAPAVSWSVVDLTQLIPSPLEMPLVEQPGPTPSPTPIP